MYQELFILGARAPSRLYFFYFLQQYWLSGVCDITNYEYPVGFNCIHCLFKLIFFFNYVSRVFVVLESF